ncbi:MAG: prenyltransferase/squalene oxidase repeat-containing protein [Fidelibacterota bacterium]
MIEHKNPKLMEWFDRELRVNPIYVLYHGYYAPVRYEILKNFLLVDHDDERLIQTEQDMKTATRRVNLLLTLERIIYHIDKFEESRKEEMLVKLASMAKELRFYYCSKNMTYIRKTLALLIRYQNDDGSFPVSPAANIFIIETFLEYGIVTNPYLEKAMKWLLHQQNPDKGWGTTDAGHSDIWMTCKALHAFSYCARYSNNTKIRKGLNFVLDHLYDENRGGIIEGREAWQNLSDGFLLQESYSGGVLSVLEMLARLNMSYEDPRISKMLEWLKDRQMRSGHWPSQTYDPETKRSDERVSMRAVRVLKLFYIMPRRGTATIKTFHIKQDGRTSSKRPSFLQKSEIVQKDEETEKIKGEKE